MSERARTRFRRDSTRLFQQDNPLLPLSRIITESEFKTLERAVDQCCRALHAFLVDHYSGERRYEGAVIPKGEVDAMVARSGEAALFSTLKGQKHFRFIYGPDIIRRHDGSFRVLEDNTGAVGGLGDLVRAREIYETLLPDTAADIERTNDPRLFYDTLAQRFSTIASKTVPSTQDAAFVHYAIGAHLDDKEYQRVQRLFSERGITLVTPHKKDKKLVVERDGVYLVHKSAAGDEASRQRVGFVYVENEMQWVDWDHPAMKERALLDAANQLLSDTELHKKHRNRIEKALVADSSTHARDLVELDAAIKAANIYANPSSDPVISNTPWGRATRMGHSSSGKVNLGQNGSETVVMVVPDICRAQLRRLSY